MKPMFLGNAARRLFGVYHPAPRGGRHAVVLCYPGVQDLNSSHWAFRRLAGMLARDGHHVLRFDYYGTGDSAGESHEGTPADWIEDIRQAGQEVLELSGARSLSLVGLQLGAALATQACTGPLRARRLILWEPVVRGASYIDRLQVRDDWWNLALLHSRTARGERDELIGEPFTPAMRGSLERLDLTRGPVPNADNAVVFTANPGPEHHALQALFESGGIPTSVKRISDAEDRNQQEQRQHASLPSNVLLEISNELRALLAT